MICSKEGCARTAVKRGMCNSDYMKWRRRTPAADRPILLAPAIERFWSRIDKNGPIIRAELGPCWIWTAGRHNHGYGIFYPEGIRTLTHRFALSLVEAAPPDKPHALHRCDNPPCCNPDHLRWGTHAENMKEAGDRGRMFAPKAGQATCKYGHAMVGNNVRLIEKPARNGKTYTCRVCRQCSRDYLTHRRAERKLATNSPGPGWQWAEQTACVNGHDLTDPNNIQIGSRFDPKTGKTYQVRRCIPCRRLYDAQQKAARSSKRKAV